MSDDKKKGFVTAMDPSSDWASHSAEQILKDVHELIEKRHVEGPQFGAGFTPRLIEPEFPMDVPVDEDSPFTAMKITAINPHTQIAEVTATLKHSLHNVTVKGVVVDTDEEGES